MAKFSLVTLPLIGIDQHLWEAVTDIAHRERMGVGNLISLINERRTAAIAAGYSPAPLASAVRVFVVAYLRQSCGPGPAEAGLLTERRWDAGFLGWHA